MKRKTEWIKFGALLALAVVSAVGFASIVDIPRSSHAQPAAPVSPPAAAIQQQPAIPAAQPLEDLGTAFTAVAEAVRPAVVYVDGQVRQQETQTADPFSMFRDMSRPRQLCGDGSGFIISSDGYILTNNHVVQDCDRVNVRLFDQRIIQRATVVGHDRLTDVAVLKVEERGLPHVSLGNSDSVQVGEWVVAVGNPLGDAFSFTVTAGIVSGRRRRLDGLRDLEDPANGLSIQDFIQTDAAINRGNSGGPLVNIHGQVIGINSAIASETGFYQGYGFAIPINLVQNVADQLIASGRVTRAQLGVGIQDASQEAAEYVGLDEIRGVVILSFNGEDTPAERAGLRVRDVIVELDGEPIEYTAQLQQLVGFKHPGDVVTVTVLRRGGERHEYRVRLEEADTEPREALASTEPDESATTGTFESRLGIAVEPFDRATARRMGLPREVETGLAVVDVDPYGPADGKLAESLPRRGMLEIITHVEDQRVETADDLERALRGVAAGEIVSVRAVRVTVNGSQARPEFIRTAGGR